MQYFGLRILIITLIIGVDALALSFESVLAPQLSAQWEGTKQIEQASGVADQTTIDRRIRSVATLDHRYDDPVRGIRDSLKVEQVRSVKGEERQSTGTAILSGFFNGSRMTSEIGGLINVTRISGPLAAPLTAVATLGKGMNHYRRQESYATLNYKMSPRWLSYGRLDVGRSYDDLKSTRNFGALTGVTFNHAPQTLSTVQVNSRRDIPNVGEQILIISSNYKLNHAINATDKLDANLGQDRVKRNSNTSVSSSLGGGWLRDLQTTTFNLFIKRGLARRELTDVLTQTDSGGGQWTYQWDRRRRSVLISANRSKENKIFAVVDEGQGPQTFDVMRLEHSIGVVERGLVGTGRVYDLVTLSALGERSFNGHQGVKRLTLGIGYYARF